jgi:flagella basal body P-ring formation protein FlgA
MKTFLLVLCFAFLAPNFVWADTQELPGTAEQITIAAERFLRDQLTDTSSRFEVAIGKIDARLKLQSCDELKPFLTPGSKAWGKITLGVKCLKPALWTIYVPAQIKVFGDYYVASKNLSAGQMLTRDDIQKITGELSNQTSNILSNPDQIIGKTLQNTISSGTSLRLDILKSPSIIQQGQAVKVMSSGAGFSVSTEAVALNNASEGQIAKARTNSGSLVSGIAKIGGFIEIVH